MRRFLIAILISLVVPVAALAADRSVDIIDFSVYPEEPEAFDKKAGYTWPEVTNLNALITVELAGFRGEEKVDVYMAVFDNDGEVVSKHKGKHFLPVGEHDIVFPRFITTEDYFGRRTFRLECEVSLSGTKPVRDHLSFALVGPDAPEVDIYDLELFNPSGGRRDDYFEPGDEFTIEVTIEIEDNDSRAEPELIFFAAMEEDLYLIDPRYEYYAYTENWGSLPINIEEGVARITAYGRLPYYFAEPYDFSHYFRIYAIVKFGGEKVADDYIRGRVYDPNSGEHRQTDEVAYRLIELERSYRWEVKRIRGGRPDIPRYWN